MTFISVLNFPCSTEYHNEEGNTLELHLVGKIRQQLSTDPTLRPEYPSSFGLMEFSRQATEFTLGRSSRANMENRVNSAVHTVYTMTCYTVVVV